jgi:flagellar M-ring protein FliF
LSAVLAFFNRILARYTLMQRVLIIVIFLGIISSVISLVIWAGRPEYQILFSNLPPANASQVVTELQSSKIPYKLENGGQTILVPAKQVAELRLRFAENGYGVESVKGYELIDDSKIGMTTFMQELNLKRALEGELMKTINQFAEVRNCRVHLVLPENRLFEAQQSGSASVVVHLEPGRTLTERQVKGIASLVSNSVKGVKPENVVVVDSEGNLLSSASQENQEFSAAGTQWDLKSREENRLQQKIREIVESIVGPNNAVVKVALDMNFEQVERTLDVPDPDNVVVLSEEISTESGNDADSTSGSRTNRQRQNAITNYEVGRRVERYVGNTGTIRRLSVAVLVNGYYNERATPDGKKEWQYSPRSAKELDQIAALVKSAVGFDEQRGDKVEVQNIQLSSNNYASDREYFEQAEKQKMTENLINRGLIGAGLLIAFIIIRSLFKSMGKVVQGSTTGVSLSPAQVAGVGPLPVSETPEPEIPEDVYMMKLSPEAKAKLKAKDRMTTEVMNYAKNNPEDAAKLIRAWLTRPQI